MLKFFCSLIIAAFTLMPHLSVAETTRHLYGCYFSQSKEAGEWVTTTKALFIEKADDGILVHGSVSSWKNSWISSPDNISPVLLTKSSSTKYRYLGAVDPDQAYARCELVLHHDKQAIYVNKFDSGCNSEWNTGDGVGPSQMSFDSKQPNPDLCLSYLGIVVETAEQAHQTADKAINKD